ncbi:MAG TPA: desulfoferrodoxin [Pseudobacillus sp.]
MANQLGKRFECKTCGIEVLCTKAGGGSIECCGNEMELKKSIALPTAD